jgi:23S rRNA (pseudouridine1915-N3)-methyltransferase
LSLEVQIVAIGTKMPTWVEAGVSEYLKRIPKGVNLKLVELSAGDRGRGGSPASARETEAQLILAKLEGVDRVIALDERGQSSPTKKLAHLLDELQMQAMSLAFVIGGPDGLSQAVLDRANSTWSLSAMTFPHAMVRVILVEQIYRALMINSNHPYHRE